MKVIAPVTLIDSMVTASSVAEPAATETAWVSGTTYAANDVRIRPSTHRQYQRVSAGAGTTPPESDTANWEDIGPTQKWAMFDAAVNTQSSATGTLSVTVTPGLVGGLALMELVGSTVTITQKDAPGGTVVYTKTISLDGTLITDWYQYFFEPYVQKSVLVLTDLCPYPNNEITITIAGAGSVKCGVCLLGMVYDIGGTQYGASAGIIDYSAKVTDAYGTTKVTQRAFSKRLEAKFMVYNTKLNKVHTILASLRSTPALWIGAEDSQYANPMVVLGFYKDFSIAINYPTTSLCSMQIEGVI